MAATRRPPEIRSPLPVTRRRFLAGTLAAGALTGIAPRVAWGNPPPHAGGDRLARPRRGQRIERRTFFFDLSHEEEHATATYHFLAGGNHLELRRVKDHPGVLRSHRQRNQFLRGVPDSQLTHFVLNVPLDANYVTMAYVKQNADPVSGTWNMSAMYFLLPTSGVEAAARRLVRDTRGGTLPLSAKRTLYGHGPARSVDALVEEAILLGPADHASAMIGLHPDLLSVEAASAATVHKQYIEPNGSTVALAVLLQAEGPATPQQTAGQPNSRGWATLTPTLQDNGQPFINQKGQNAGLIQYHPEWHPVIANAAQSALTGVLPPVKQDTTLGADVTGLDPSAPPSTLAGALWKRHDGVTTVDQSPDAAATLQERVAFTVTTHNTESGFNCTGSAVEANGTVRATLTFTNWYVRWLGIYLLFLDANGNVVQPDGVTIQLPTDYEPGSDAREKLQQHAAMFGLMLGPEYTILGVPVESSTATMSFNIPPEASTVRVFASGPSFRLLAPPDPNDPQTWGDWLPGMICTVLLNYGMTVLFMVAGASAGLTAVQKAALPFAASIVVDLVNLFSDLLRNKDFSQANPWQQIAVTTLKTFSSVLWGQYPKLATLIFAQLAAGEAEDASPLAGQIAQIISAAAGAATLAETDIEIAASPISYVYDLTLAHDLHVAIQHDPNDDAFPASAASYKVTALFDQTVPGVNSAATPHTQTLTMPTGIVRDLPPVVFKNVPLGGTAQVTVGFYANDDRLVGQGTTGVVANDVDTLAPITIEEFPVPIHPNTVYEHKRKTTLTGQGTLGWSPTPSAPTATAHDLSCETAPGNLCELGDIAVRQGTATVKGYLGYAWQASSPGIVACQGGGQGQLYQVATLGDQDAQSGYASPGCGFGGRVKLTYSLLASTAGTPSAAASNFYLETSTNVVRRVRLDLDPPQFDPPSAGAWGVLNLESDDLLMHPSGRLVSIHRALHKMEILKLPHAPLADAEAHVALRAQVHAGVGSRPGLMSGPAAAAVSPDGVILVLENGNRRIQAFDIGGNPVRFFTPQPVPYFLDLAPTGADTEFLDLAVEYTGYLYVLSFDGQVYRLDIYHPGQPGNQPIATTLHVNAAKLAVDFWRNVYTLNYEVLRGPVVTEPSVSQWVPSTP